MPNDNINEKPKRGRPKKVAPPEISETKETRLQMTDSPQYTTQQVMVDMNQLFAKVVGHDNSWVSGMNTLQLNNPFLQNQRLKIISGIPGIMDGKDLADALGKPQSSEIPLRKQGLSLSSSQYLYYQILRMAADVPLYKYYKTPEYLEAKVYDSNDFKSEDAFVDEWLETFDLPNTLKRVALEVKREGKAVYVLRNSTNKNGKNRHVNYCTWQKMPSDYVKLTGIGEHGFTASFNMLLFMNPAFNVCQYPDFIKELWDRMAESGAIVKNMIGTVPPSGKFSKKGMQNSPYSVDVEKLANFHYSYSSNGVSMDGCGILESAKDSYMFWVQLPQELCYVFSSDTSHAWAVPDTSGLFLGLQDLTDYDTLAGLIVSTPLTALLTAEVPLIADSNLNAGGDQTALSPDTIMGYQNKFNSSVSSNLDAYIAPFKNIKLQSLPNVPNSSDITTKATQNFITKAGVGGLITSTEKPSVAQIKASQLLYESQCDFVTRQFESVLNMIINDIIGTQYRWKLHIWGGIYTFDAEVKRDKELFVAGATFVLPKLASAYGMTLRDVKAADAYINSLDLYKDFETITQEKQNEIAAEKEEQEKKAVGRPSADVDSTESENTLKSIDAGNNTAEMRDFAKKALQEGRCIICGAECDDMICEDCREEYEGGEEI